MHQHAHSRHHRARGRRPAAIATGLLVAASLVSVSPATAADTIWPDGTPITAHPLVPQNVTLSTGAQPTYIAYEVDFTNTNPSTLTQVVLRILPPTISNSSATATFQTVYPADASCTEPASGGVRCDIGQFRPGETFDRIFVWKVPARTDALVGQTLTFRAVDTILTVKEGSNDTPGTRTDTFNADQAQSATLIDTPVDNGGARIDFFSTYVLAAGGTYGTNATDIETEPTLLNSSNNQATKVTVPSTNNGTKTVIQEITNNSACPAGELCFGDLSQLSIPGVTSSDRIRIFVRWDQSIIPAGTTQKNLKVAWNPSETAGGWISVTTICSSTNIAAIAQSELPCRYATKRFKDKDLGVAIVTDHNGWTKGY